MDKCLSIAVIVALLSISLAPAAHSRPLSWGRTSRYQRSIKTESAVTDAPTLGTDGTGRLEQTPVQVETHGGCGGAGTGGGADNNATEDTLAKCMEKCYYKNVSRHEVKRLKKKVFDDFMSRGIHPGFLVSEWLENYHRVKFCSNWENITDEESIRCEDQEPQISEDIKEDINSKMRNLTGYGVYYNESHYPRYAVDVQCEGMVQVSKDMPYLRLSEGKWEIYSRPTAVNCKPITGE